MRTVARFSTPEEAHLFRTRLEAAGLEAYVQDENFVQLNWLMSNAVGGVRVQVADEDFDSAREFFSGEAAYEVPHVSEFPCPSCASERTAVDASPRRLGALTMLLLMFGQWLLAVVSVIVFLGKREFRYSHRRWRCHACNHLWRPAA